MNDLFQRFGGQSQAVRQAAPVPDVRSQIRQNPRAFVGQLKQDPAGFMRQFGVSLPQGIDANNPMQIIQALYGNPPHGMFGRR